MSEFADLCTNLDDAAGRFIAIGTALSMLRRAYELGRADGCRCTEQMTSREGMRGGIDD